ncbi:coiled-coil domain-containing protein 22 homolog [Penaeus japonicus]|uniref:coiled-coil domain-containing protein 22 homolog n=1 Tax=Penaeus japonicus TaxID=27405 RepID=UPI001C710FF9|nr:coiled-coil domain-containing protein 22 homolog [Penaeus japonicus]
MEAKRRLAESLSQPWIPPHCRHVACNYATKASVTKYGTHHTRQFESKVYTPIRNISKSSPMHEDYYKNHARTVTDIVGRDYIITSLLRAHALQLESDRILPRNDTETENKEIQLKPLYDDKENIVPDSTDILGLQSTTLSSFETSKQMIDVKVNEEGMNDTPATSAATSEEKLLQKREEQVSNLQSEIAGVKDKIELSTQGMEQASNQLKELVDKLAEEERLKEEKVAEHKMKKRIANLVPESESNIQRLKEALKNSEDKMARLKQQWEAHRQPLEEQLSQLNLEVNKKKVNKEELLGEMTELRDKMKAMVQDASRKESALAQLKNQFATMNKDINRSVYTKRIIDISAKVRKQKQEIDRVLADTRTIQKEINTLSGKLERTFTVVEGTAYKEAGNNERVRQVYRAVAAVHEGCGELVDIVRETGTVQREISELKEQVDLEKSKKVEENLEQLKVDLNQVKKENASLKQQLL